MRLDLPGNAKALVLYDGVCNLCNRLVRFILARDRKGYFAFAPLHSVTGKKLLAAYKVPPETDSIVLIEGQKAYIKSKAVFRVLKRLDKLWPVLTVFRLVPLAVSDMVYDWIARRRYYWFGKKETCPLPEPGWQERFMDI